MDKLTDRLTRLEARLSGLKDKLGDPRLMNVVIECQGVQTVLSPRPSVLPIHPDRIGQFLGSHVEILGNEEVVSPVYRTLPEEYVTNGKYILDATWNGSKWDGIYADVLWVDRTKPRQYTVYIARGRKR